MVSYFKASFVIPWYAFSARTGEDRRASVVQKMVIFLEGDERARCLKMTHLLAVFTSTSLAATVSPFRASDPVVKQTKRNTLTLQPIS